MARPPIQRPPRPAPPGSSVYDPDEGVSQARAAHSAAVAETAIDDDDLGLSADVQLSPYSAMPADTEGQPVDRNALLADIERIRKMRKPLGTHSQKLALPKRPGYKRHWFNDSPGRIEQAKANGWAHVKDSDGQPISRVVGAGRDNGALRAYAMELPEVFWLEDMAARHAEATAKVEAIKKSPFRAEQGTAKPSDRGKFYDPQEDGAGPLSVERY